MLPLHRQEHYRARFGRIDPTWLPATAVYERLVQQYLQAARAASLRPLRVLDAGCGAGGMPERLAAQLAWPVGIDPDLASLQRHRADITRLAADVAALPFGPATFDLVVCSWVLEHLATPQVAAAEMARVLKPGGQLIVLTPNANHWLVRLNRLVPTVAQTRLVQAVYARAAHDTFPVTYRLNTVRSILQATRTVGLQPVVIRTIRDPSYLAFNDMSFVLSILVETRCTAAEGIHIVGAFVKRTSDCPS